MRVTVEGGKVAVAVVVVSMESAAWKAWRADDDDATFWAGHTQMNPWAEVREECCVQMRVRYGVLFTTLA